MTITISTTELLADIKEKTLLETGSIEDADLRYRIQAGSDKVNELYRDIESSNASLIRLMHKFITPTSTSSATDAMTSLPSEFVYELDLSERRAINKAQAFADKMHDYLVDYTLAKFYASVSAGDLSNKYSALTLDSANQIESLLYQKMPPSYS